MWEKQRRKAIIKNVILGVLALVVIGALLVALLVNRSENKLEDQELVEAYTKQQEEQTEARQQSVEAIQTEYEKDLATIEKYLPGIVCWGDAITGGTASSVSYPSILKNYINTYICDVYNFADSIPNANDYGYLDWNKYTVSIPVINMGTGEENSGSVLGRSGAAPFVISDNFTIPDTTEPVNISITTADGHNANPLSNGDLGMNPVTINGIEGTLERHVSAGTWVSYTFARSEAGTAVDVERGTEILPACADLYKDYIHVVCIGTFDMYETDADKLVENTRQLLARQTSNQDRYIVLGLYYQNGMWINGDNIDNVMSHAFGNHYINVRKYLCTDALKDAGITPTSKDNENIKYGSIPDSFRSTAGKAELTSVAYKLIGKLVYDRMDALGYFDEIRDELYINETTRQIIKNDPGYFEKMIAVWNK